MPASERAKNGQVCPHGHRVPDYHINWCCPCCHGKLDPGGVCCGREAVEVEVVPRAALRALAREQPLLVDTIEMILSEYYGRRGGTIRELAEVVARGLTLADRD